MLSDIDQLPLENFRLLVEESLTGVYIVQQDRLVYANRRLAELFGYSREEMLRLPSVLEVVAEEDRPLVREMLRQRIAGEIEALEYTVRGLRKDGQLMNLDVRSVRTTYAGAPAVMGSILDITGQKKLEEALKNLSLIDELTGVYNRRGFMTLAESHLALARRKNRELLLLFADLDDLKDVNDNHGHAAGDQVLIDAAAVLRKTYRAADIIGRIGGDEFTALPLEAGAENAATLMERLRKNIDRHNSAQDRPYRLSMSVGVGCFNPGKCQSVRELMAEADEELYRQKRNRNPSH